MMETRRKKVKNDHSVRCGYGLYWAHGNYQCEKTIPDSEWKTMQKHGWGWLMQFDPGMPEGVLGYYQACPDHKWECP